MTSNTVEQIEEKLENYEKEYKNQNESMCNRIKGYEENKSNYLVSNIKFNKPIKSNSK